LPTGVSDLAATVTIMEVMWSGLGFLIGMSVWMPFIIDARMDAKLTALEDRINLQQRPPTT
jgi:hypothetical protein